MSKSVSVPFRTAYSSTFGDDGIITGPGLTRQSFKDECDINSIMRKFESTGVLPENLKENPQYGDFDGVMSYQDCLQVVIDADEQFGNLSARIRKRFDNDPAKFLEFVDNPDNVDESYDLGIRVRPVPEGVPVGSSVASEVASAPSSTSS